MKGNRNITLLTPCCANISTLLPKQQINQITCVHNANYAQSFQKSFLKTQQPTLIRPSKSNLAASKYLGFFCLSPLVEFVCQQMKGVCSVQTCNRICICSWLDVYLTTLNVDICWV